jgi:hypothetical protein
MLTTTTNKKISSMLDSVVFDSVNNQVLLTFNSRPEPYVYNVLDGHFNNVTEAFNNTDSLGKTYHELNSKKIITPTV